MISDNMKTLVVKTGYSETFQTNLPSDTVSLGDVLRTTPILHVLPGSITWITSINTSPMLENISRIDSLIYIENITLGTLNINYDLVIYLEHDKTLLQKLTYKSLILPTFSNLNFWQEKLFDLLDMKWNFEPYLINSSFTKKSCSRQESVIGLNYLVGPKIPSKAIPTEEWKALEHNLLADNYIVTWQEGHNSLETYINWVNSTDIIVTTDSLGLHLALALEKKVICIFKASSDQEVYFYNKGKAIHYTTELDIGQIKKDIKLLKEAR